MIIQILLLIIGFILLIKGADWFVDGSSSIASNFKLSKMLIGLTIVAFGTSAPEFAVSVQSIINNSSELLIGNVIGSNIINVLLIIGISAVICPLNIKNSTVKKEFPILLLLTTLFTVVILDGLFEPGKINILSRSDGVVIFLFFLVFIYYLIMTMRKKKIDSIDKPKYNIWLSIIWTIVGIILIIIGSNLVVKSATNIAKFLGVSERIIALTVIALGTSLPELVTSIVSALKKEQDILVGNIIGSNIFNICVVLGIPVALFGNVSAVGFQNIDLIMLMTSSIVLFILSITGYKITKREGIFMLILFGLYYSFIIMGGVR